MALTKSISLRVLLALGAFTACLCDEETHTYKTNEPVIVWLNKVGPYHNPQETYSYYSLPFCAPPKIGDLEASRFSGISQILEGSEYINSNIPIQFGKNVDRVKLCSSTLTDVQAKDLSYAISNHYWYQMYFDDLPIWGMVGEVVASEEDLRKMEENKKKPHSTMDSTFVYTRKKFSIEYNGNQVIEVNLTSEEPQPVVPNGVLEFSYSVVWKKTTKSFDDRFNRYLDYTFFEHQIHWFSIFNSFMMVIFLCGLVSLILMRTLKNDYAKYTRDDDDLDGVDRGVGDDSGWKQVHGDVFRAPPYLTVFSALLGTGAQLIVLVFSVISIAIIGSLYMERGAMMTTIIVCYALSSIVGGYASGGYYKSHFHPSPSPGWIKTLIGTTLLLPAIATLIGLLLNSVSLAYGSLHALPFTSLLSFLLIWGFVSVPLTIVGTILGRQWAGKSNVPCRVNQMPRPIPDKTPLTNPAVIVVLTGLLPFGSIFIEMYYIFTSFWNYKFYYVYGFMLLVYIILVIVSVCVTIVAVYVLLNAEDYRWPWLSFLASASTAVYVFLYSVYYFFMKTNMSGFLQTAFYFGYMGLFCTALSILCGTIGMVGSSQFVRRIYQNIKID